MMCYICQNSIPVLFVIWVPLRKQYLWRIFIFYAQKLNTLIQIIFGWALNQDFMKPQIQKYLKGTILPFISKDALATFRIPLPNIDIQKKIINLLRLRAQEKEIQEVIDKKKNTLMNKVLTGLL